MSDILLICVAGLLVIGCVLLYLVLKQLTQRSNNPAIVAALTTAMSELSETAKHYVQVNAVLALAKTFEDNPDLLGKLSGYSEQVVGAALLHRVNSLGVSIRKAQELLERNREHSGHGWIERQEKEIAGLHCNLAAADAALQQFTQQHKQSLRSV